MLFVKRHLPLPSILIPVLGCPGAQDDGEWVVQVLTTDAEFKDAFFRDALRGWVVGGGYPVEGGIVGSTVDGGRRWSFKSDIIHGTRNRHNVLEGPRDRGSGLPRLVTIEDLSGPVELVQVTQ